MVNSLTCVVCAGACVNEAVNVDDARWSGGVRGWPDLEAEPEMLHCFSAALTLEMRITRHELIELKVTQK